MYVIATLSRLYNEFKDLTNKIHSVHPSIRCKVWGDTGHCPTSEEERRALVEQRIQEAMARGEFDDLPGQGQPLRLNENPYLEPGQELAFGLLKKHGFAPAWIERDKEIRRDLATARGHLQAAWQQYQDNSADESRWQAAVARFEQSLHKLNHKIDDFNLMVPIVSLQRPRLRLADELQRVQKTPGIE